MGKQSDHFTEAEGKWLRGRYHDDDIQDQIAKGGSFLTRIADTLTPQYDDRFGTPRPPESQADYQKRYRNADAKRKKEIVFREKEKDDENKARRNKIHGVSDVVLT